MDEKKLVAALQRMNDQDRETARRQAATELLLIGLLRSVGPEGSLMIERDLATFAQGTAPADAKKEIIAIARSLLEAAYEPPSEAP